MLIRRTSPGGLVTYASPLLSQLSCPHGFTTRVGPGAPGNDARFTFQPAATDVSHLDDPPPAERPAASPSRVAAFHATRANFDSLKRALGCPNRRTICTWQVHGADVFGWPPRSGVPSHWPADARDADPIVIGKADALVTRDPAALLAVRIADCVPVLLATAEGGAVAAVHAGWRGVAAGAVGRAARRLMEQASAKPSRLVAAIGPCISVAAFEVGEEVAQAFEAADLAAAVDRAGQGRPHIDLPRAVALQLGRIGVPAAQIDRTDRCTFRDEAEFFSHRRDAHAAGRMAAVIGVQAV